MYQTPQKRRNAPKYNPRIWKNLGERYFGQKYEVRQKCVIGTQCPWDDQFTREHHTHYLIKYETLVNPQYTTEPWPENPKPISPPEEIIVTGWGSDEEVIQEETTWPAKYETPKL